MIRALYEGPTSFTGYSEFGRDNQGQWHTRRYSVTRNQTFRRPTKWVPVGENFNLSMLAAVDPDKDMPKKLEVLGVKLIRKGLV